MMTPCRGSSAWNSPCMRFSPAAHYRIPLKRGVLCLKKFVKKLWENMELYMMVVLMIGFILTVLWGIISRVVFHSPASWTEELARIMFIWMVFLGISYSTLHDNNIRVTVVANALFKGTANQVLNILIYLLTFGVFAWIFTTGIQYIGYCSVVKTPAMQLPRSWFVTILPLTGFLMILRSGYKIFISVKELFTRMDKEVPT